MICKTCRVENERSTVHGGNSCSTAMYCSPFWDADGVYHHHDTNTITTDYSCSRGHKWTEKTTKPCPALGCTWKGLP